MSRELKAFQFWVKPVSGSAAALKAALSAMPPNLRSFDFSHYDKNYQAKSLTWDARKAILTGTVYLLRTNNLPSAVKNGEVERLPIDDETDLGEPMCFAFHPEVGAALVHYAHTGPRHSVLSVILDRFIADTPITVEPVLRQDMLLKLARKTVVTGLEYTLSDPAGVAELRTMGGPVGKAISMLTECGGVSINVQITMGHTRGEGLVTEVVKGIGQRLASIATENAGETNGVSTIKVKGSDGEGAPIEELDLLRAREPIKFEVRESHRSIDTDDACRILKSELANRLAELRAQLGTT